MNTLTVEEREELLLLTDAADSVELKLSVPEDNHISTSLALGLDPIEAEVRQVYFFDTPNLALDAAGVVVRTRRIQGGKADTVIKLRPVAPNNLPKDIRRSKNIKVEVDLMPGCFVGAASMTGNTNPSDVQKAVSGKLKLKDIFSKEQLKSFKVSAPEGVKLKHLSTLGPIFTLKLKVPVEEYGRELVAELWHYPNNSRILELSTKCKPSEVCHVVAEAHSFLMRKGIDIDSEQVTKTKTALHYFSKQLG